MAGSNTQEATDRLTVLKDEISRLDDYEKLIDQHKSVRCNSDVQKTVGADEVKYLHPKKT